MSTRFMGYGIKIIWPIFKTDILIYLSKANSDGTTLFVKLQSIIYLALRFKLSVSQIEFSLSIVRK